MSNDCIFCKIVEGAIPSTKVFENNSVIAFADLRPQAKKHYLFIHRTHSTNINTMVTADPEQVKEIFLAIQEFSSKQGLEEKGFRVVTNLGPHAGQTVFHTHFHLLSGEPLGGFGS
jgi:histidine triad (HIT) family protein